MHIVLVEPQIPQNTGNIGRLCAVSGARLHLIHPLGFAVSDKHLRRSGMDYWHSLDVCHHASWDAFAQSPQAPQRLWLFTTRAQRSFWQADFQPHDGLVFGNEGHGAPDWLHERLADFRLRIPHRVPGYRSLNLSTSVGIALYEALRQTEPAAGS